MVLGLTGGLGCGKSTAAKLFEDLGYRRIDSDAVVRDELLVERNVESAVGKHFGSDVLTREGRVDRSLVARKVFLDDEALRWLENLLHPLLFEVWKSRIAHDPKANWVVEVPLLFEKGLEKWFDFTVCVSTTSANQLARLAKRGLPQPLAEQRILKQLPLAQKRDRADFVLSNDGSYEFLRDQVVQLAKFLQAQR